MKLNTQPDSSLNAPKIEAEKSPLQSTAIPASPEDSTPELPQVDNINAIAKPVIVLILTAATLLGIYIVLSS